MIQQKNLAVLQQLAADVNQIKQTVSLFDTLSISQLTKPPGPDQWSITQCLEHLNTYGRYYLPRIESVISKAGAQSIAPGALFSSSWLGTYFVNMMQLPPSGKPAKRYKAAHQHQPANNLDPHQVLSEFQNQQTHLLDQLRRAETVNLRKLAVPLSIAGWLSLNLGDILRFLVLHEQRHIAQAQRVQISLSAELPAALNR